MLFMNEDDIDQAVDRYRNHAVLGPATRFLQSFKEEVNSHSDGWPYWSPPVKSAAKLISLIQKGSATQGELTKAIAPIKAFITRRGAAAGLKLPEVS